jgi:hypothetical protein
MVIMPKALAIAGISPGQNGDCRRPFPKRQKATHKGLLNAA